MNKVCNGVCFPYCLVRCGDSHQRATLRYLKFRNKRTHIFGVLFLLQISYNFIIQRFNISAKPLECYHSLLVRHQSILYGNYECIATDVTSWYADTSRRQEDILGPSTEPQLYFTSVTQQVLPEDRDSKPPKRRTFHLFR